MPSFIGGSINIARADGVVNFGDTFYIAPKNASKTLTGSGSVNTGNLVWTNNGVSNTNTLDSDVVDQPSTANA